MKYLIEINGMIAEPRWQLEITMASDAMAIDYTKRLCETSAAVRAAALSVYLFNVDEDKLIGEFVLAKPVAYNKLHKGA